jgi:hypothetical protein
MRRSLLLTLFAAAALAGAAGLSGQQRVCITGVVQRAAGGPSICQQVFTHRLECTSVMLRSSSVNLEQHIGQNVELIGESVGVTCPLVEVKQVVSPTATLVQCGSPNIGCRVRLAVCPVGIGQWWLFAAFGTDFIPLGCNSASVNGVEGTWLLGGPLVVLIGAGGPAACGTVDLDIPPDPILIGGELWFQGLRRDIGPVGPLELTNAECFRIGPPAPCVLPSC